ncbi:hypothetical protein WJX72_004730 [[Myrmecia] bisecta]|uniref:Uncharacterized protein n=1 Tax=[Myrmecia] bisecta TaxID=41462 RepID=A0AAW1R672_9CHLO
MSESAQSQEHAAAGLDDGTTERQESGDKVSCVPYFDQLWFCYSPVHQMTEYYRYGAVDDCTKHWGRLYDCLKLRTKFAEQVQLKRYANPLWTMRSKSEAQEFWHKEFGHLDKEEGHPSGEGSPQSGADAAGGQTTNVGLA